MPTAGGVYHWGTIAGGPRWGRMVGFFTGWINFYGWMFDLAALLQITANISVNLYVVYHQSTYVYEPWHVYIAYVLITWFCVAVVVFVNRVIPHTQTAGMFFVVVGGIVTIIVIAAMPKQHASNYFVWGSFKENNITGWQDGVAFLLGVLNGAFTIGTPDAITHMAEELPHPKKDLPKAIGLQIGLGFLYAFVFAIAISYAITDLSVLTTGINTYPLASIYAQATARGDGSQNLGAQFGLLFIIWCSSMMCCIGTMVTVRVPGAHWSPSGTPRKLAHTRTELPHLLGPRPRQRRALLGPLLQGIRAAVVPRSRHALRGRRRDRPRRDPHRQLDRLPRPDRLLHHPHDNIVRHTLHGERPDRAEALPEGPVPPREVGHCYQLDGCRAYHVLRHILLLP